MIAPKDSRSLCDITGHKIKIEHVEDREEYGEQTSVKCLQNGDLNGTSGKIHGREKRKRTDDGHERNKKHHAENN